MKLVNAFQLLPPQLLPGNSKQAIGNAVCNHAIDSLLQANDTDFVETANDALRSFGDVTSRFSVIENDINETRKNRDNDSEFNIVRVQGDTMEVLVYSTLNAYRIMLADMAFSGTSLSEDHFNVLQNAFYALFQFYRGNALASIDIEHPLKSDFDFMGYSDESDSYRRWVHAHFVFMAIIQGIVVALNCYCTDVDEQCYTSADMHMRRAALMMLATEAALYYAGEFSQKAYIRQVRPTLIPPIAQPNMSGVHWRDHEYMVKNNFTTLKRYFRATNELNVDSVNQFKEAIGKAYLAHKQVCGKFVGNEQSSLLSKAPAVTVLDNYKVFRLKMFGEHKESK